MNTVTLSIASREDVARRALEALEGKGQGAHISFASIELLWQTLTPNRWNLLQTMTGQGGMTIREAARRVGRDIKAVHRDMYALLDAGVLERTPEGGIVFPYDAIHVDFTVLARNDGVIEVRHAAPGEVDLEASFEWSLGHYSETYRDLKK